MELLRKYTDEVYATKKEIERCFNTIGIETIWSEINRYRNNYRKECFIQNYTVVLTPPIELKLEYVMTLLHPTPCTLSIHAYQNQLLDYSIEFQKFTTHPFLLQLFLIKLIVNENIRNHILSLCLHSYGYLDYEMIMKSYEIITSDIENNDITRAFLDWLMLFRIYLEENMVNLNKKVRKIDKDLKLLYPSLNQDQCDFLMIHQLPHHYYDVKDYVEAIHCSYETARTHLQGLVDERFYRKIKIGKRYVYLLEDHD